MPRLTTLTGQAGAIVSANRAAVMAEMAAGLFSQLNRRLAEQLADVALPAPADDLLRVDYITEEPCRN